MEMDPLGQGGRGAARAFRSWSSQRWSRGMKVKTQLEMAPGRLKNVDGGPSGIVILTAARKISSPCQD